MDLSSQPSRKKCFNPRAPRGARRDKTPGRFDVFLFQSTRPARGATQEDLSLARRQFVSIHAPRAGRDTAMCSRFRSTNGFNPRAPRGARLQLVTDYDFDLYVSI